MEIVYFYVNMSNMTELNETKINKILQSQPAGTVYLTSYLKSKGISRTLLHHYVKTGWFEKVGNGAFKRKGENIDWIGCIYAIQKQAKKPIHVGGMTALRLRGFIHYLRTGEEIQLFTNVNMRLPKWFTEKQHYSGKPILHRTDVIPKLDKSLVIYDGYLEIVISSPERAILEALYLTPNQLDMVEVYQTFEGLANLRPKLLEKLLEGCSSIKVNRLFLYMARKAGHQWAGFINQQNIDLGTGKRSLTKGGVFISEFKITVPEELAEL